MLNKNTKTKLFIHLKFLFHTFADKELTLFAASLSFYTIFSFIPLLLILMTILTSLKSFADIYLRIQDFIFSNLLPINSEIAMEHINGFLQNSVEMGTISMSMLFISSLLFFIKPFSF